MKIKALMFKIGFQPEQEGFILKNERKKNYETVIILSVF